MRLRRDFSHAPAAQAMLALLVTAVALITAATGAGDRVPLDSHEIYVARTAERMLERHDWIVPYLGETPRLQKPPMNYWLACAADRLSDHNHLISPGEARAPSVVAGVGVALLTFELGLLLLDAPAAAIGALLLATSRAFVQYTHSARPEMVYAFFCAAALVGFALALRGRGRATGHWAAVAWAMLGLATLTKGPQLPAIIVLGLAAGLWRTGRAHWIRPALRPVTGVTILLAVSAWWYLDVWLTVAHTQTAWGRDLAFRFTSGRFSLWNWLEPFYLYRPIEQVVPWIVLYPLAVAAPWVAGRIRRPAGRWLWWVMVAAMLLLSLAAGRRTYYLLPVLGPMCLLMGAAAVAVGRRMAAGQGQAAWRIVLGVHVAGLAAAGVVVDAFSAPNLTPPPWLIAALLLAAGAVLVMLATRWTTGDRAVVQGLIAVLLTAAVLHAAALAHGSVWGASRFERADFAERIAARAADDAPVYGWHHDQWDIESYSLKRTVRLCDDAGELLDAVAAHGSVWLLVNRTKTFDPPPGLVLEPVVAGRVSKHDDPPDRLELMRVTLDQSSAEARP